MKEKCVGKVVFLPPTPTPTPTGTGTPGPNEERSPGLRSQPGFEWGTCDYPQTICANGVCGNCKSMSNSNVNTYPTSNTDANSKYGATNK